MENNALLIFLSALIGLAVGIIVMIVVSKAGLNKDQQKANLLLKEAEAKADATVKQAVLDGRTPVSYTHLDVYKRQV